MSHYRSKTETQLIWEDNKKQLLVELDRSVRRVKNAILSAAHSEFQKAVSEGRVAEFELPRNTARRLLKTQVQALPDLPGETVE